MSAATITSTSSIGLSYTQNVGRAARALLAALLAVNARPATPAKRALDRDRELSLRELYRLAAGYDSVMPNLAQELRYIASRG
jgi:hypothetical protein